MCLSKSSFNLQCTIIYLVSNLAFLFFFTGASNLKAEARKPSGLTNSTNTPPCTPTGGVGTGSSTSNSLGSKADIARHHIASELLQTEKNFVKILNLIVNVSHCQQHSKHNYIS